MPRVCGSPGGKCRHELIGFIQSLPKAELHIHIEGTLEPEQAFAIAARNGIAPPFATVELARAAYDFHDLQSFLDVYYLSCSVLRTTQDFYDLTWAYLERMSKQHVPHVEIFFDPQTHLANGVVFETFFSGFLKATQDAASLLSVDAKLIMCFLRHLSAEEAMDTLRMALPYKEHIVAVGLDSGEAGNPPAKFQEVFAKAAAEGGWRVVCHAGEEGPAQYVWDALNLLKAERIDHGLHCLDDPALVEHLVKTQIPLTICPLSNLRLKVFDGILPEKLYALLHSGLCATLNSDDPAYFGGYLAANYEWVSGLLDLDATKLAELANNSFRASFISDEEKAKYAAIIASALQQHLATTPAVVVAAAEEALVA